MNDYKVTRLITSFGYACGFALIALCAVGGLVGGGIKGLLGGLLIGAVLSVPWLMFCEMMHAVVTIANNTKTDHKPEVKRDSHAA